MWLALIIGVVAFAIIYFLLYVIRKLNAVMFLLWLEHNRKNELNQIYRNSKDREISDDIDVLLKESKAEFQEWVSNEIKNI